jgi:RNA polymerase sigma-70 factor (ECF subfamily)
VIDATVTPMTRLSGRLTARAASEPAAASAADARADELIEALVREEPVLLAAARAMTLHEAEARDLVQATFELALRHGGQLREPAAVRGWLLRIQAREALRLRRRIRRFVRFDPAVAEVAVAAAADAADRGAAESLAIREALRSLPARTRAAVVLHHMAGLSVAEVAEAMGTSPNTVKTQLRLGLARLREVLGDD